MFVRGHHAARCRRVAARLPQGRESRPGVSFAAPSSIDSASWRRPAGRSRSPAPRKRRSFPRSPTRAHAALTFVNIRENAGWSRDAPKAAPKIAALLAAAAEPLPDIPYVTLKSDGVILIYGRDEKAIEAAELLKDHLDVTVLITKPSGFVPRRTTEFPVVQGNDPRRQGPSRRVRDHRRRLCHRGAVLARRAHRSAARATARSRTAIIILDLSGGAPLFPAADLRDGYLRADPGDPPAMLRAVLRARDLVGTFDKPRYVEFKADLCAHSRSQDRRLPPLSRSVPDRRDHARRRSCRDRSA